MRSSRWLAGLAVAALLLGPASAEAGTETFKRSMGNLIQSPIDLVLSPITAGIVQYRNMTNVDDTTAVRIGYAIPGYFWLTGLHAGASILRGVAGALELLPGMVLLFLPETEMDPLFDPVDKGEAVIFDYPTAVMDFKIGVDYTAAPF